MTSRGQHQHLLKEMRFKMPCLMLWKPVIIILTCISWYTMSFPIHDKETGQQMNAYMDNGFSHSGRTLKQADDFFDECEFGNNLQNYDLQTHRPILTYDETCPDGATDLIPCNPGELKVDECIGQNGNTSSMCDHCPQKFYQSYNNKCTRCHQCSECGPNEEISESCTHETDTVCRSIIPPDPVNATSPTPDTTTKSQPPSQSTATTTSSTTQQSVVYSVSSSVVTYGNVDMTTEITATTENKEPVDPEKVSKENDRLMVIAITASVLNPIFLVIGFILFCSCLRYRQKYRLLRDRPRTSSDESSSSPSNHIASPSSEPESSQDHHDEKPSMFSHVLSAFDVFKDSIKRKQKKKGKEPCVKFHKGPSTSGPSQSDDIRFRSLPSKQRTNLEENNTANVDANVDVESGSLNKNVPGSTPAAEGTTTHTAEVHRNPQHIPEARGSGDGDSLMARDAVHDSRPSHNEDTRNPDSVNPNDPASHSGQDGDAVPWLAEKVPGSTVLPLTCRNVNESTELPEVDSDERWHAEKVPGTFTNNDSGTTDQDMVTDAPRDEPRTLHSGRNPQAPIAGEEEYEEAIGANTNEANAPTADTEEDVQEPETTAGNNNEAYTTVPTDTSEDEDEDRKPWNQRVLKLFNRRKQKNNKKRRKEPTQQTQQLITTMDIMVDDSGVEYVADNIKLKTLDKLCRELGLADTEVANYNFELKSDQNTGAELAFKMLVKVRGSQGAKFTYRKLDRALRRSYNVHVADNMVSELRL